MFGGGFNPRKMKQMMEQMGIDLEELDAEGVVIRLADGSELVFDDADVTKMEARGQETYQIVGEPETRAAGEEAGTADESGAEEAGAQEEEVEDAGTGDVHVPDADVELVVQRTGADEEAAREALEAEGGDLAAAISRLE